MAGQVQLLKKKPIEIGIPLSAIEALGQQLGGRLLISLKEVETVVPLHRDTILKLVAPGGEWDRYGMVRRFSGDGPRNVLVSLPMLIEWSMGGPGNATTKQRLELELASMRLIETDLRQKLSTAEDALERTLAVIRDGRLNIAK